MQFSTGLRTGVVLTLFISSTLALSSCGRVGREIIQESGEAVGEQVLKRGAREGSEVIGEKIIKEGASEGGEAIARRGGSLIASELIQQADTSIKQSAENAANGWFNKIISEVPISEISRACTNTNMEFLLGDGFNTIYPAAYAKASEFTNDGIPISEQKVREIAETITYDVAAAACEYAASALTD